MESSRLDSKFTNFYYGLHAPSPSTPRPIDFAHSISQTMSATSLNEQSSTPGTEAKHKETQARMLHIPSPPRVWFPPAQLDDNGLPNLDFIYRSADSFASNSFSDTDFLTSFSPDKLLPNLAKDPAREWQYEHRREAQEVLPFLFLGPDTAARKKDFLTSKGITMVMAVRDSTAAKANFLNPKAPRDLGIEYQSVDVNGAQQLIAAFPRALNIINAHVNARYLMQQQPSDLPSRNGRVLVFCETGNERSAAVVGAYIMAMYSVTPPEAVQVIQASRFCVALDYQMGHLLRSYHQILEARRDVLRQTGLQGNAPMTGQAPALVQVPASRKKRGHEEATCDDDVEMEEAEADDVERFRNREGVAAPFADI